MGEPGKEREGALRPTRCPHCLGPLHRGTDLHVVVCWDCGNDYSVLVSNDYLVEPLTLFDGAADA